MSKSNTPLAIVIKPKNNSHSYIHHIVTGNVKIISFSKAIKIRCFRS